MALIGGLLIVGIGIFMLGLVGIPETHGVSSSQGALCSFLVVPLMQVFVVMFLAFFQQRRSGCCSICCAIS